MDGGGIVKDYKRLTKLSELGTLHVFDIDGKEIPLCDVSPIDSDNLAGRLADLEDKIESGELCDREEVRKETAMDILQIIKDYAYIHVKFSMREIAKKYGVDLEEQQ